MMAKDVSSPESKVEDKKPVKKREKNPIPTKLIIRRLPPGLTQEELLAVIEPLPPHDYFRYVSGDRTLAPDNFCRAYINLASPDDILEFRDKVDGLEFTDSKGNSQPCVLEYAPFQKNPKKTKKKEDYKSGTLDEDADYKAFLESLEAEEEKTVLDLEKYLEELEKREQKKKCVETPLTAFLKKKREERKKIRDERRRVEQERRKKRDEERKRRDAERKKKLETEKNKKKKEDEKKSSQKKDEGKKEGRDGGATNKDDQTEDSKSDKSESRGKGDAKLINKGKFELDRSKTGPRLSDTKLKKSEGREPSRRGPIGSKPKDRYGDGDDKGKDDRHNERPHSAKDSYYGGGSRGGGPRGRGGYRSTSSREFTRKWDKGDDARNRGKPSEEQEKKPEKTKSKRPDREIYRPGSARGGSSKSSNQSSHKYSEQRSKPRQDEEK